MSTVATIPFEYVGGKTATPVELEKGDLLISGWAIRFDEIDREGEGFDGSSETLWRSVQKFVADRGPLAWHHDMRTTGIGSVIDCERVDGVGIRVKSIIGYQPSESPWRHIYEAARKGHLRRFSFQGIFKRRMTSKGPIIEDADLVELSICGTSIGKGTTWQLLHEKALSVPQGKALSSRGTVIVDDGLSRLRATIERQEAELLGLRLRRAVEAVR